ncbi:MAG TPA: FtsX-like permease family protein [Polyangiaceae bacterium]|jgi:ABC-type lipoprotein release transport system permease subunit|nr:FtsX-like permease family protein [Polyangiaceae bacterium]
MLGIWETLGVIAQIAIRNLFASRWKTLIVGGIIGFGALLVVAGTSLLDGVDHAMSRSIIGSVAGHIQVYSNKSKDELDVMGGFSLDSGDIAPLDDFAKLRETLLAVPNVDRVVPMGISGALVNSGNTVDQALADLRENANKRQGGESSAAANELYQAEKGHVRQILSVLSRDFDNVRKVADERAVSDDELEAIKRGSSDDFWNDFDKDPFDHLEFLENRVAPLATDADMLQLRYLGTDPAVFAQAFDRMVIVDGTAIPPGQRGFLFSKYMYEEQVKLKAARGLDKMKEGRDVKHLTIAKDLDLQRIVRENSNGVRELLLQLDAIKTARFRGKLQTFLSSQEADVGKLLAAFFKMDDGNFDARYKFFYDELAPDLELYRVRVGDRLTIKAYTKSGYVRSASLKVYGTYAFKGLERSPQAGSMNMMDLVSFRELYGFMTAEREKEIAQMRESSGAREIDRNNADAELFGTKDTSDTSTEPAPAEATAPGVAKTAYERPHAKLHHGAAAKAAPTEAAVAPAQVEATEPPEQRARTAAADDTYDPKDLETGVVLNAAVLVKDERLIPQTMAAIEQAGVHAGLPLKAVSWQKASGFVGQFATLMRVVLFTAVLIIFVVALVVINNALVMATLERVREIGMLRAIGAQRRFVLSMLVVEAVVVGILFGALGSALGALILSIFGKTGIPATSDVLTFFFSGPRLYPTVGGQNLVFALVIVLVVSVVSSLYPAWIATRVSPREAMQSEE